VPTARHGVAVVSRSQEGQSLRIYVDADACPVKQAIYRVAQRHGLGVTLVAGSWMRVSGGADSTLEVVDQDFDAADDWIVAHATPDAIVVTADIPLAARCLAGGGRRRERGATPPDQVGVGYRASGAGAPQPNCTTSKSSAVRV
jgi:uncharacterized protein